MRAVAIRRPGEVVLTERPEPHAGADIVTVRILVAPMCTEFRDRRAGHAADVLGHEAAGVVVDAGRSTRVRAGDRVVVMPQYGCGVCGLCTAGEHIHCPDQRDVLAETGSAYGTATYAEFVLKPDWLLLPIPDDIGFRHAALTCCGLGPGFNALNRTGATALDTLVVSGCGPVGLGTIVNAAVRGVRTVALEPDPFRAELAVRLGAETVLDPADPGTLAAIRGADCAVETSGAPPAAGLLARALRPRGRLAVVAWGGAVTLPPLVPLGLEIHGCWHWNHQRDAERMWRTVRAAGDRLDQMITHEFPLEKVSAAMDVQDTGACGKILLLPNGTPA